MRLFIIENTTLRELAEGPHAPSQGDVVAYFRPTQALDAECVESLMNGGIAIEWAEQLLTTSEGVVIDNFFETFATGWFKRGEWDPSKVDGLSLGEFTSPELAQDFAIGHMVRFGEICRRLLEAYPDAAEIVSDCRDGTAVFICDPQALPRRLIVADMSARFGRRFIPISGSGAIKAWSVNYSFNRAGSVVRSLIGGLRPRYLRMRLCLGIDRGEKPRGYLFFHSGIDQILNRLSQNPCIDIFTDRPGYAGTPLRFDHFPVVPPLRYIRAVFALRRQHKEIKRAGHHPLAVFRGIDYTPYFCRLLDLAMGARLFMAVVKICQVKRMLAVLRLRVIVINGMSAAMRAIIHFAPSFDTRVIFVGHGLNSLPINLDVLANLRNDLIWMCQGDDHPYGTPIPQNQRYRCPAIGSTLISTVFASGIKREVPTKKRVLMIGYGAGLTHTVTRVHNIDHYMIDLLSTARELAKEGYSFTFRHHPGPQVMHDYLPDLVARMGVEDIVHLEHTGSFADALASHDVLITNLSSCIYQSLAAGWPIIIHEPDYDPAYLMGIMAARDLEKPISTTREELISMVRSLRDPSSLVSTFPQTLLQNHEERFFGRQIGDFDAALTTFIAKHLADPSKQVALRQHPEHDSG